MDKTIFAVQYLESPYPDATTTAVRQRLSQACERLPISFVLLGCKLPPALEEAVAEEATRQHAQLFRWLPLLTGDSHTYIPPEWATIGPGASPVLGYSRKPEFTFICPNRSAVEGFLSERVECVADSGLFQGIFLDRILFPSPSIDPLRDLACFCGQCTRLASDKGLDLESVRHNIQELPAKAIVRGLLGQPTEAGFPLESFLDFRIVSINRTVRMVAKQAQSLNLSIGLDCFSPALTRMVDQDLSALDEFADWVKIMTYPRVFDPAGISFELLGMANWLTKYGLGEIETMHFLEEACGLPVPANKVELGREGIKSKIITQEIRRGYELGVTNLLAGIAMVNMERVHESTPEQIHNDLQASRNADGLVISWDLWLIPLEYFNYIRTLWS